MLKDSESNVIVGLGTYSYTAPAAGIYYLQSQSSVLPPSSLSVVMKQNSTTIASSASPSTTESNIVLLSPVINAAEGDVLEVIFSSAAQSDNLPNAVKSIVVVLNDAINDYGNAI